MKIDKKVWPEYFEKLKSGDKTYELRLADWECSPGDILVLREWDPQKNEYTGRTLEKQVSHVFRTKDARFYPKDQVEKYGYQVISLQETENILSEFEIDPSEIEVETEEEEGEAASEKTSTLQSITFALGGLTIGVAIGAGAMSLVEPKACIAQPLPAATTTPRESAPTKNTAPAPRSSLQPAAQVAPTTSAATATPATTSSAQSADGTI